MWVFTVIRLEKHDYNKIIQCFFYGNIFSSILFRGGGELGRQWYLEGKLQSKHKGFEVLLINYIFRPLTSYNGKKGFSHRQQKQKVLFFVESKYSSLELFKWGDF